MSRIDFPKIYNPANQTPEELIDNFVVRTEIFKEIYEDIQNSPMKHPEQHYIIQGVRGQGKTTLLLRIAYEINKNKELRARVIPIVFNEEQYNISRLFKLWETIAEYLQEDREITGLYGEMQKFDNDDDYERLCFELLENTLRKRGKKLILFIDNIDEMLGKFTKKEHQRLREVLMESAEFRIVGASSVSLEFHYDYGQPFYQFFRMPQLRGLTAEETETLLLKLGEHYKTTRVEQILKDRPGRIESLRRLTGGVIRTIVILFEIFVDDENGNAFMDLEMILDRVTPLYKHRMDKLSAQQQEIVDCVALTWDAVSSRDIADKTKLSSKAVSAQLKQLERHHIIEKVKTGKRNFLYRISERFFNIWYLMREGRKWDEKRVRFLVEFLQIWCDEKELEKRAERHLTAVDGGLLNEKHALYMTEALAATPLDRELQHRIISETRAYLDETDSELRRHLSRSDQEFYEAANKAFQSDDFEEAIHFLEQIRKKEPNDFFYLGTAYLMSGIDLKKAERCYLKAAEKGLPEAMNNLASLYKTEHKDYKKAEQYYLMAVEKGLPWAMNNLAWLYFEQKKNKIKALEYAEKSVETEKDVFGAHTYSMVLLWNDEIEKAIEMAQSFLKDAQVLENDPEDVSLFLLLLIAKKQYHLTLKIFEKNPHNLKDRFKPIYYALMYFMKKEFPDEYLKMGGELRETVDEVIERINLLAKDYA